MYAGKTAAQEPGSLIGGFETQTSLYDHKGLKTVELGAEIGLHTTRWLAVAVRSDLSVGMFDREESKTYLLTNSVGTNLMFSVLKTRIGILSINAGGGSTVGANEWKYSYYTGGVYLNLGKGAFKPFVGAGVKYYDTYRRSDFDDYFRVYFSFGFRWF